MLPRQLMLLLSTAASNTSVKTAGAATVTIYWKNHTPTAASTQIHKALACSTAQPQTQLPCCLPPHLVVVDEAATEYGMNEADAAALRALQVEAL